MNTTTEVFQITDIEQISVVRSDSGDFYAVHSRNGEKLGERSAFGSGDQGRINATKAARQWAFGITFDRTR